MHKVYYICIKTNKPERYMKDRKKFGQLAKLGLDRDEFGEVRRLTREYAATREKISREKSAARMVWEQIEGLNTVSLGNVEEAIALLHDYRASLLMIHRLVEKKSIIAREIRDIVCPYREPAETEPVKPAKVDGEKTVKFCLTRDEVFKFIKTLTEYVKSNENARKMVIEIDRTKLY